MGDGRENASRAEAGSGPRWRSRHSDDESEVAFADEGGELADYLFERTGGMIGSLSQLVRGGAVLAIDDGSERITRDLLDLVPVDHAAALSRPQRRKRHRSSSETPADA